MGPNDVTIGGRPDIARPTNPGHWANGHTGVAEAWASYERAAEIPLRRDGKPVLKDGLPVLVPQHPCGRMVWLRFPPGLAPPGLRAARGWPQIGLTAPFWAEELEPVAADAGPGAAASPSSCPSATS